ncbi:hypothetical protein LX32DRAFT_657953 [Colletotrichum zoysiae]|uniref:Uncharacterized protein n=1 Tax=Colletotrichum zoysiae TaxID=1216348 RepID=A0AAD9H5C5_9PEZI|nr:hypothetical protein LX32DRAFT_657953 [Colletotrichum zoysiae]
MRLIRMITLAAMVVGTLIRGVQASGGHQIYPTIGSLSQAAKICPRYGFVEYESAVGEFHEKMDRHFAMSEAFHSEVKAMRQSYPGELKAMLRDELKAMFRDEMKAMFRDEMNELRPTLHPSQHRDPTTHPYKRSLEDVDDAMDCRNKTLNPELAIFLERIATAQERASTSGGGLPWPTISQAVIGFVTIAMTLFNFFQKRIMRSCKWLGRPFAWKDTDSDVKTLTDKASATTLESRTTVLENLLSTYKIPDIRKRLDTMDTTVNGFDVPNIQQQLTGIVATVNGFNVPNIQQQLTGMMATVNGFNVPKIQQQLTGMMATVNGFDVPNIQRQLTDIVDTVNGFNVPDIQQRLKKLMDEFNNHVVNPANMAHI